MAGLPDEDVPTMSSVELKALVAAETGAPRAPPGPAVQEPEQDDNEDRTVQAMVEPPVSAPVEPVSPRPLPPRPAAGVSAAKGRLPPSPSPTAAEDEEEQDSITATAPRVRDSQLGLSIPTNVQIRTVDSDDLVDETEVATLTGSGELLRAVAEAAERDEDDDGPTTQALAPSLDATPEAGSPVADEDDEPRTTQALAPHVASAGRIAVAAKGLLGDDTGGQSELVTRPGVASGDLPTHPGFKELPTKTGVDAPTKPGVTARAAEVYDADAEDSITSRAMASVDAYEEDSVTTQAPVSALAAIAAGEMPTMDRRPDDTDATTQKKSKAPATPADEEQESITTQAPGHLTNMLRVIAAEPRRPSTLDGDDEDQLPENRTAVMANAPMMKHGTLQGMGPVGPIGPRASAAPRLQPGSESGLRVARDQAPSGEHASLGAIGIGDSRGSLSRLGDGVRSDGRIAITGAEPAFPPPLLVAGEAPRAAAPPRYGLLVAVVALVCLTVPIALYSYLRSSSDEAGPPKVPSQLSPDFVGRSDALRGKAVKGTPAPSSKKPSPRR